MVQDCNASCSSPTLKIISAKYTPGGSNGQVISTITQSSGSQLGQDIVPLGDVVGGDGVIDFAVTSRDSGNKTIIELYNGSTLTVAYTLEADDYPSVDIFIQVLDATTDYNDDGKLDMLVGLNTTNYIGTSLGVFSGIDGQFLKEVCYPKITSYSPLIVSGCEFSGGPGKFQDAVVIEDIDSHSGKDFVLTLRGLGSSDDKYVAVVSSDNSVHWAVSYEGSAAKADLELGEDFSGDGVADFYSAFEGGVSFEGNVTLYEASNSGPVQLGSIAEPIPSATSSIFAFETKLGPDIDSDGVREILVSDPQDNISSKGGSVRLFSSPCQKQGFEAWMYPVVIDGC